MTRTEIERLAVVETHVEALIQTVSEMDAKIDDIQARIVAKEASDQQIGMILGRFNKILVGTILISNFILGALVAYTQLQ